MVNREEIKQLVRAAVEQTLNQPAAAQQPAYYAPWTGATYESHPSQQQFDIGEAAELKQPLLELVEQQLCTIEKDRVCDHCGMCKSLGF
jgi:hypothetical protein